MNSLLMALDSIREKKGRSFLTMLGIIIGVTAVLVLVALVSGYNADITAYYEKLGVNKVTVNFTWYDTTRAPDVMSLLYDYGNGTLSDKVEGVSPSLSTTMTAKYRTTTTEDTTVYFGGDQWSVCNNYTLDDGRDILDYDIESRSRVCVIGSYVAETLFQYADPIGQTIYLNAQPFTVVGTFYQKDGSAEDSMDNAIAIPYTLVRAIMSTDQITAYTVKVNKSDNMTAVINQLDAYLTGSVDSSVGTYKMENGNSAMTESNDEMTSMSVVLGGIAGIALLVGGIGIMNIMLVTVTERTREIGIKKSIGAPRGEIVSQFLVEAAILSGCGGLIGIGLGFLLSAVLGKIMYDLILFPSTLVTVGAFLFSVAIGIVFGIYPAVKASNLQPVDALRAD
ncbi:Efflux ABC transporter, permease protein [uncultured Eubacteriales bacterium]|uniref:Efflux ABC transporter, permease protein n=1 Tax=uncultured Eubacteriales bacterium TaxID=172733 RepID=A0A212J7X8_9FIRM|nr:Efflux ABC transporter, permease protein [uncultured Eubacteriales bacterium]